MPKPKLVCHDCNAIFNRRNNRNQVRTTCVECNSSRITPVTTTKPPPSHTQQGNIPAPPDPSGLPPPRPTPQLRGGAITPELLVQARKRLTKVVRPPVVLPGPSVTAIARGIRVLAHEVKNTVVGDVYVRDMWRRPGEQRAGYIYTRFVARDVGDRLREIASGVANSYHQNYNDEYRNRGAELPLDKGNRTTFLSNITYYEYGWKTRLPYNARWVRRNGRLLEALSQQENNAVNSVIQRNRGGETFSERLIIAETGEVFYTPDHYENFYRYHPGTRAWYWYRSAGGHGGPLWDESFYDERYGT